MKGLMIQGTSSDAGKSFIVTGLCRLFSRDFNLKVCPFKSQNMSNISYKLPNGLEMALAQAVQARAAGIEPEVFMNPILLKPRHEKSSDIILNGKLFERPAEKNFYFENFTENEGIKAVREALSFIKKNFETIIIEGAGSPAEINLNAHEIVNMRIAREADVPVILVTDVDRGGSIASAVGTLELLGNDRERVKGIIFNKFRGDINLFDSAVKFTENYTGVKVLGVVPFAKNILLEAEDSLSEASNMNIMERENLITGEKVFDGIADLIKNNLDVNFLLGLMS